MSDLGTDRHPSGYGGPTHVASLYDANEFYDDAEPDAAGVAPPPPSAGDVIDLVAPAAEDDLDPDSVEAILADAIDLVAAARPAPMSSAVKVDRDELLDLLEAALDRFPTELRDARWLLRDREALLEDGRRERAALIEEGRRQVAHMVDRQEVVRAAERKARTIVDEARAEARSLQHKVEDYCDARLAEFEGFLGRTASTVRQSRQRLAGELPERRRSLEE